MYRGFIFFVVPWLIGLEFSWSRPAGPTGIGQSSEEKPRELERVGIQERLGEVLDGNLTFINHDGQIVSLSKYFSKGKPLLLSLVYYNCPGLCSLHLNGVLEGLQALSWSAGKEFEYLTVSFDPKEHWELARDKRARYLNQYGRESAQNGWHFLVGDQSNVELLTQAVGFSYRWDEKINEWAHASALIVLSPTGVITRYLHGIVFEASQIQLALSEAVQGKVGSIVDQLIWFCYRYDPAQSRYVVYAMRLVQLGGGLMVLLLGLILIPVWRREL